MDELNRKLEDILNDPESMEKVRILAESLLGDDTANAKSEDTANNSTPSLSGEDVGKIMNILGRLNGASDDSRTKLLLALKPHLTEKRRQKVDSAIKLLKLIELLPLIKESGMLDFG